MFIYGFAGADSTPCEFTVTYRLSLIDWNSGVSVRSYVHKKFFSDIDQIWCVGRPRPNMPTRVTSTRSKVKVKVKELLKFRKLHFSTSISSAILAWGSKLMVGDNTMGSFYSLSELDFGISF